MTGVRFFKGKHIDIILMRFEGKYTQLSLKSHEIFINGDSRGFFGFLRVFRVFHGNLEDSRGCKGIPGDSSGFSGFLEILRECRISRGFQGFPEDSRGFQGTLGAL